MAVFYLLVFGFVSSLIIIYYLVTKLRKVSQQISHIEESLIDIKSGNWNRRILTDENDMTKSICYSINELTRDSQNQFIQLKQSEKAYKRLMTSLSHDVKTPLTSLVGYLEAVEEKFVSGEEKEEYVEIALAKAHYLKKFLEMLFDWVKLDANEQVLHLEQTDIYECTRDLLTDWILTFEENHFSFNINIPNEECYILLDKQAYLRIINNVLQNATVHSSGTMINFNLVDSNDYITIEISDNGKGVSSKDLPHIFERLYQGDQSRSTAGNGLGLAITKELVHLHNGMIYLKNLSPIGTQFTIKLPKAL